MDGRAELQYICSRSSCCQHLSSCQLFFFTPGCVAQSVMCLATDARLTADPGVAS